MKYLLLLFFSSFALQVIGQPRATVLNANDFSDQITTKGIVLVDIRTPQEFQQGHIDGAININFYDRNFYADVQDKINKNAQLYIYCRSGNRTSQATTKLEKLGYLDINDLQGGIISWISSGKNLVK